MSHDPFIGQTVFGDYEIVRELGSGGMGAVYLAENHSIGQKIAIKLLHGDAAKDEEIRLRFQREGRVISMLSHPNIVRVFIFGRVPPAQLYMAMEFVEGRDLRDTLRERSLSELEVISIIKQCCSALSEAHDLGIVHRDLKPENILITSFRGEANYVKILDFGIAKITEGEGADAKLTQAGIVYGTPAYLSPEQAQAFPLDRRTDIYSLGIILYELMTGRVPFQAPNTVMVLTMHVFEQPELPENIAPDRVSPTMSRIIQRAIAKNLDDRFQDAMELYHALEEREREILGAAAHGTASPTAMFDTIRATQIHAPAATTDAVSRAPIARTNTAPTAPARPSSDNNRTIMLVMIAFMALILVALLVTILLILVF